MIKELKQQEELSEVDLPLLEKKIGEGIQQLDNGEGTDFRQFLNEMKAKYGSKE